LHHHVEGGDAVRGNDQQFVVNCINVPDLPPPEKFEAGDVGFCD